MLIAFFSLMCLDSFSQGIDSNYQKDKISAPVTSDSLIGALKNAGTPFKQIILSSVYPKHGLPELVKEAQKEITRFLPVFSRNPVQFNKAIIQSLSTIDSSYLGAQNNYLRTNVDFISELSLAGIPVNINLKQQSLSEFKTDELFQLSVQFDRDNYLAQLKKRLSGKMDPSAVINSLVNPLEGILASARRSLMAEIEELNTVYKGKLDTEIGHIKGLQDLFRVDVKSLKAKFMSPSFLHEISEKKKLLSALQQKSNNGEAIDKQALEILQDEVQKLTGIQSMLQQIEKHKTRWEESGLLKKLKEFELFKQMSISKFMNDPSTITKLAREKLSLSGLQKLFLSITRLNVGQNVLSNGPLSFNHFISKGISTEFLTNKRSIGLLVGRQTDFNSLLDYPFTNAPFSNTGIVKAFGIRSGIGSKVTTNLSVSSFSQVPGAVIPDPLNNPSAFRQVLVTTISNQLEIGEKGLASIDLSRSATQYTGMNAGADSLLQDKSNLSRILSTGDFMDNTAVRLRYADELTDKGISYNISFNRTANGYTNPGNSFLSAGTTEIGTGVRKLLFKDKLVLSFKGNRRVYKYNELTDASWLNSYVLIDARWKFKKGQYVAFRYQPVRMARKQDGHKDRISAIERIAADVSIYKRFGKVGYRHFVSLTGQKNMYLVSIDERLKSNTLSVSSFQQIIVRGKMFYLNLNCNYSNAPAEYLFMGSSLYAEAGCSYQFHKYISGSTGFVYNDVNQWYRQAGIRQTLTGELGERFNINLYLDVKRNLRVIAPLWNDPVRADLSLRYIIKK